MRIIPEKESAALVCQIEDVFWVIVTRNAPKDLDATLTCLVGKCGHPPERVLVSDDSDDQTEATFATARRHGVHYVPGPKKGIQANRWHGFRWARSHTSFSHVCFLDDDMDVPADAYRILGKELAEHPIDILVPVQKNAGSDDLVWPTEMNWKGVRRVPAPSIGGAGLTDSCMIWPAGTVHDVDWDATFRYGYGEAWIAVQAKEKGHRIRIVQEACVVHRRPGGGFQKSDAYLEAARVYYNTRAKALTRGALVAASVLAADFLETNVMRLLRGKMPLVREYVGGWQALWTRHRRWMPGEGPVSRKEM